MNLQRSRLQTVILDILLITLTSASIFQLAQAYFIQLDAGADQECFHETVPIGSKLGFSFEVIEGGFYDVDVEIKDPQNVILHQDERSSHGKFTIKSNLNGPYQFCFSNKKVSFAPKIIIFDIDKVQKTKEAEPAGSGGLTEASDGTKTGDETSDTGKLVQMIDQLMLATISARHDVRYLTARDRAHRKVNESTNSTIVWWSTIEFLLLLGVTVGQVIYLKQFFETRRKA